MERVINKIKLYCKENTKSKNIYDMLLTILIKNNFNIVDDNFDLGISIGGDGTFLKMIHENNFNDVYYIGINTGTLGFLPEINADSIEYLINHLNNNDFKIKQLCYLKAKVLTDNKVYEYNSLNEIVLRNSNLSVLKTKISIDNHFLEDMVGDGLIISTPTGSTAYNMSLNGAIIDNNLKVIEIMPIAPINNSVYKSITNPLILSKKSKLSLSFFNKSDILIMDDGVMNCINDILQIDCEIAGDIKVLAINNNHFIDILHNKIKG